MWALSAPERKFSIADPNEIQFPIDEMSVGDKVVMAISYNDGSSVEKAYPIELVDVESVSLKPMRG